MRSRLFLKFLLAFFVAFCVQVTIFSVIFFVLRTETPKVERSDYRAIQGIMLDIAASGVAHGMIVPPDSRFFRNGPLVVRPAGEPLPILPGEPVRTVRAPSGEVFAIAQRAPPPIRRRAGSLPAWFYINIVGLLSGLIFAAILSLYMLRPIIALRDGFQALASGDLKRRLRMTGRRDEVADLARDFNVMADRIERLIAARNRLMEDVSHELRSPLTRLRLAIALARQRPERTVSALDRVESEAERLDELVGELLTLSRLESGVSDGVSYFDLTGLLRGLIADARFESGTVRIAFETQAIGDAPRDDICGDPELIRRAVENIVRNALRYSPEGGTVTIRVEHRRDGARIEIADEGPGAPEADLPAMFEPFVRGEGGNFGLGLSIAHRAVLAHGGRIVARNRTPTGLIVTIDLPVEPVAI